MVYGLLALVGLIWMAFMMIGLVILRFGRLFCTKWGLNCDYILELMVISSIIAFLCYMVVWYINIYKNRLD